MFKNRVLNLNPSSLLHILLLGSLVIGISGCKPPDQVSEASDPQELATQIEEAQSEETLVHLNLDEDGIALRGYDPVAYFTESKPVKGQQVHSFVWNDATWHFATAENRDLFSQDPEKYAPANGGYCTFGIVLRKKFDGDPTVWSVIKSRLYVFLNEEVQQKFLQDSTGNLQKVSANWPTIQFKSPDEL